MILEIEKEDTRKGFIEKITKHCKYFLIKHKDTNDIGERIDNISAKDIAVLVDDELKNNKLIQIIGANHKSKLTFINFQEMVLSTSRAGKESRATSYVYSDIATLRNLIVKYMM